MKVSYLIRLDDASPYMDSKKWAKVEGILDKYGVKPLIGIIPANADPKTMIEPENNEFWENVHCWIDKGWEIALHGYDHVCVSDEGLKGLNPVWKKSEFSGVSLEQQRDKIRKGVAVMEGHGVSPHYFFAPSHTYDNNTLKALESESDIHKISDSYSLRPYRKFGFSFIPCQMGRPREMKIPGFYTICLHPNQMNESDMGMLKSFLENNQHRIIPFNIINESALGEMRLIDKFTQWMYFIIRKRC